MEQGPPHCNDGEDGCSLLLQLDAILSSDPLLDELGFVHPSQLASLHSSSSQSPPGGQSRPLGVDPSAFWCSNHKLAISVTALSPIYKAVKPAFLAARRDYEGRSKVGSTSLYRDDHAKKECSVDNAKAFNDAGRTTNMDEPFHEQLISYSRVLCVVNSGHRGAWNIRKQLLKDAPSQDVLQDLQLSSLVLSQDPKCEEAWAHRRWVLLSRLKSFSGGDLSDDILQGETKLIKMVAERSRMNYRAWRHCCWLVPLMSFSQVSQELQRWKKWAELHVADNCCFQFRRCLLERLFIIHNNLMEWKDMIQDEMRWNGGLIDFFTGREALWVHRRFLFFSWTRYIRAQTSSCLTHKNSSSHLTPMNCYSMEEQNFYLDEIKYADMCISTCNDDKTDEAQRQLIYAATYKVWILLMLREINGGCQGLVPADVWDREWRHVEQTLKNKACHQKSLWAGLFGQHFECGPI